MGLKILHTGDLHIEMRYARYPEAVRRELNVAKIKN